ncbi:hypothetical protein OHA21_17730 [Actinoplanes sp. NBC_00393]|uniref:hypothetical protein n=1 Tax=Actinoplanes sp. NBC_00393 TaxID=2975953 RepID=UPI002E1B0C27
MYDPPPQRYIGQQDAEQIINWEYNQYVQARDNFLRDIASARTKARHLVVVGFLMVAGGCIIAMLQLLSFMNEIGPVDPSEMVNGQGPFFDAMPLFAVGFAIGFVGQFVLLAGIVMHIVAASRRRGLRDLQARSPWAWQPPMGR